MRTAPSPTITSLRRISAILRDLDWSVESRGEEGRSGVLVVREEGDVTAEQVGLVDERGPRPLKLEMATKAPRSGSTLSRVGVWVGRTWVQVRDCGELNSKDRIDQ